MSFYCALIVIYYSKCFVLRKKNFILINLQVLIFSKSPQEIDISSVMCVCMYVCVCACDVCVRCVRDIVWDNVMCAMCMNMMEEIAKNEK